MISRRSLQLYGVHDMEVRNGISSNLKKVMNNLVLTKKRVLKAEKLHKAQLATFKKGVFTSYKPSVFEEKQNQARNEVASTDS